MQKGAVAIAAAPNFIFLSLNDTTKGNTCKILRLMVKRKQIGGDRVEIRESGEMYLETIYTLLKKGNPIQCVTLLKHTILQNKEHPYPFGCGCSFSAIRE